MYVSARTVPSEGRSTSSLSAGRHTFPFCFVLPEDLPSSFEGVHGYVRYVVKAIIDRPWKFDHTTKCNFTVIGILNLNSEPNASVGFIIAIIIIESFRNESNCKKKKKALKP